VPFRSEEKVPHEHQCEDPEGDQETDEHSGYRWSTLDRNRDPCSSRAYRHEPRPTTRR
jgi:hypothetical protein